MVPMSKSPNTRRAPLALICAALAVFAVVPASAVAQVPAENEYDLAQLPNADGDSGASTDTPAAPVKTASTDSGGTPVLPIVLVGAAAVFAGLGIWRMRRTDSG